MRYCLFSKNHYRQGGQTDRQTNGTQLYDNRYSNHSSLIALHFYHTTCTLLSFLKIIFSFLENNIPLKIIFSGISFVLIGGDLIPLLVLFPFSSLTLSVSHIMYSMYFLLRLCKFELNLSFSSSFFLNIFCVFVSVHFSSFV